MQVRHYPQQICLTSIYSLSEYYILYMSILVMSINMRCVWVYRDRFHFNGTSMLSFFKTFLR